MTENKAPPYLSKLLSFGLGATIVGIITVPIFLFLGIYELQSKEILVFIVGPFLPLALAVSSKNFIFDKKYFLISIVIFTALLVLIVYLEL